MNPYVNHGPNLESSATKIIPITPHDVDQLTWAIKALRVWNPNGAPADIKFMTSSGAIVTVTVPAASLWIEAAVIVQVFLTGTSTGLILHGFTD